MSNYTKKIVVLCSVLLVFTTINYLVSLNREISRLTGIVELEEMRSKVNTEWTNELLYQQMSNLHSKVDDTLVQQGRMEGVTAFLRNEEDFSSLWHEGYTHGLVQNDYVAEMQYEQGYRAAMKDVWPEHPELVEKRPLKDGAILIPDFDRQLGGSLPSVSNSIEEFNKKVENLFNEKENE
jgi:hypothetical protein